MSFTAKEAGLDTAERFPTNAQTRCNDLVLQPNLAAFGSGVIKHSRMICFLLPYPDGVLIVRGWDGGWDW